MSNKPLSPFYPTIADLAAELRDAKLWCEAGECLPVRLRVSESGWVLLTGDPQNDADHEGWWGVGSLCRRSNSRTLARDLIAEAKEDRATWYSAHLA
jgi:hypothetical protein